MITKRTYRKKTAGGARRIVLVGSVVAVAVLGVAAFKYFMNRPGEAAIQLIPADAGVIGTLDTNPSERQVLVFKKINDAIQREGLSDSIKKMMSSAMDKSPLAKDLEPYISKNFAFAVWTPAKGGATMPQQGPGSDTDGAVLMALTDSGKVASILQADAPLTDTPGLFVIQKGVLFGGVIKDYLVMVRTPSRYAQIQNVANNRAPSAANMPEYQAARAALPSDSNLMVFISPKVYALTQHEVDDQPETGWMSYGVALRDDGLAINYRQPQSGMTGKIMKYYADAANLDPATLHELPEGAYGVFAMSEPGKTVHGVYEYFSAKKDTAAACAKFEKESGLSVMNDIVPAIGGNVQLAVYPGLSGKPEDVDMLLVLDSAHGADPKALALKARAIIERESAKHNDPAHFTESSLGPATIWRLDDTGRKSFQKGMGAGQSVWSQKEPILMLVNGSVIVASSNAIANKVGAVYLSHARTLADDIAFSSMSTLAGHDSQCVTMISLNRVLGAVKAASGNQMDAQKWEGLFGGPTVGVVGTSKYDGKNGVGTLFIPLDWDKAIKLMGAGAKSASGAMSRTPMDRGALGAGAS